MPPEPARAAPLQIAFLTGQSDPARCGLSPQQHAFLAALHGPGRQPVTLNFPYRSALGGHVRVPLPLAALRNGLHLLAARRPGFAARHRPDLLRLLDAAGHTVLLAGSCGLELLTSLALSPADARRVSVFAYGPVARRRPDCARLLCVRGDGDRISRRGYRGDAVAVGGGHMDYLQRPEVLALCRRFIDTLAADGGRPCAST